MARVKMTPIDKLEDDADKRLGLVAKYCYFH